MQLTQPENIKYSINYISNWLYDLNHDQNKQKYKNLSNDEFKNIYSIIEIKLYNKYFNFTQYETNKKNVIIYFLEKIYEISFFCANQIYINQDKDNNYLIQLINNDKKK